MLSFLKSPLISIPIISFIVILTLYMTRDLGNNLSGFNCRSDEREGILKEQPLIAKNCDGQAQTYHFEINDYYIKSCFVSNYKDGIIDANSSSQGIVNLKATLPNLDMVDDINTLKFPLHANEVSIDISYTGCKYFLENLPYDQEKWIESIPDLKNSSETLLYSEPTKIASYITEFKAISNDQYHKLDIYVVENAYEKVILRCNSEKCFSHKGIRLFDNILVTYSFHKDHMRDAISIHQKIKMFIEERITKEM